MSTPALDQVWKEVVKQLSDNFPPTTVTALFETTSITELTSENLLLTIQNPLAQQFIRKYAEPRVLKVILEQTGITPAQISFQMKAKGRTTAVPKTQTFEPRLFQTSSRPHESELEATPQLAANLNSKLTFKSFIVGNKNRLAVAAAKGISEAPGVLYNPLYMYGGVGLGKTHLMQAIGNAVIERDSTKKVLYVACEHFLNEFVAAIKKGNPESFKKKYRNIDVFLVDDIQFIAGRDGVQEEFFHTFNALHQAGKQIVMTSDKKPSEIKGLEERLSSRFSMGMVTDLQLPDQSTRLAILQTKCQEKKVHLPEHILQYIADQIDTNVRELEGALTTVIADLAAREVQPTLEEVRLSLRTVISSTRQPARKSTASLLTDLICDQYQVNKQDLIGPARQRELVHPRHLLMYLLKHEAGMTYPMIGKEIGGRDHTTIMHGVEKITHELKKNPAILDELHAIKNRFYETVL